MAQVQVPVRLPEELVKRLDKHVERMQLAEPGIEFTRADAVRTLVVRGLGLVVKGSHK